MGLQIHSPLALFTATPLVVFSKAHWLNAESPNCRCRRLELDNYGLGEGDVGKFQLNRIEKALLIFHFP